MTFSIAARCLRTGSFGMAISSSSPAVAARCVHLRAGVGAVASQNITDPRLGTSILNLLENGRSASEAIAEVVRDDPTTEYRQLTAVDGDGNTSAHSGVHTLGIHAVAHGDGAVAAGNMLRAEHVVDALLEGYLDSSSDDLAARLVAGLMLASEAGGEEGPLHSAGVAVVEPSPGWATTDLRVDWNDDPIAELQQIWSVWQPQRADYVTRGINPSGAPTFGVPGDR